MRVGESVLEADQVFVDVGARAYVPELPGLEAVDFLTNSSMMDVDFLPEHLIIIGGSYVGLEFAQMYRRFGSRVTVVELADRLIRRDDEDVSLAVKEILEAEGVTVRLTPSASAFRRRVTRSRLASIAGRATRDYGEPSATGCRENTEHRRPRCRCGRPGTGRPRVCRRR